MTKRGRSCALPVSSVPDANPSSAERSRTCDRHCGPEWVEEVILQSYLFAGFPRALNAAREWRRISGRAAPESDEGENFENASRWRTEGEATCATVYGPFYERLRHNIRQLHPALDAWMIVDGYGKVLSRPALDLRRRELCVVAACATGAAGSAAALASPRRAARGCHRPRKCRMPSTRSRTCSGPTTRVATTNYSRECSVDDIARGRI